MTPEPSTPLYFCPYCYVPRGWIQYWIRNVHILGADRPAVLQRVVDHPAHVLQRHPRPPSHVRHLLRLQEALPLVRPCGGRTRDAHVQDELSPFPQRGCESPYLVG